MCNSSLKSAVFIFQKWKKNWFVLYPASQNGIARLEFFDVPSGSGGMGSGGSSSSANDKTRKLDKKIIRLSECISILPALTENCPKENMAAFCVETNDKTYVFAAEKSIAKDWMNTMCDIAFQVLHTHMHPRAHVQCVCVFLLNRWWLFSFKTQLTFPCVCVCLQGGSGGSGTIADSNGGPHDIQMSENLIYCSREQGRDRQM